MWLQVFSQLKQDALIEVVDALQAMSVFYMIQQEAIRQH